MKRTILSILAFAMALSGCGDGGLTREDVTDLPSGDATGNAYSGDYEIELYTTGCSGKCSTNYEGFTITYCDVGDKEYADTTVTQNEGSLQVDLDQGDLLVTRLEGGIDQDGSFEIGGYATQLGGSGEVAVLSVGSISSTGDFNGTAEAHLWGSYEGSSIDCSAKYDLSGARVE